MQSYLQHAFVFLIYMCVCFQSTFWIFIKSNILIPFNKSLERFVNHDVYLNLSVMETILSHK